jgi:AcrR family transcriptional regulator
MNSKTPRSPRRRRKPTQRRAQQTVETILDAVVRILKREGSRGITTNHVAEVAGVSIGSLYQYFPDKSAIFVALHGRHIDQIDRAIQDTLIAHATSSLEDWLRAMIDTMINTHTGDLELFELLGTEVPHRADGTKHFAVRLHGAFRLAIAARAHELKKHRDFDKMAFVVAHMVESLSHGVLYRRPPGLSMANAKAEIVHAILAYVYS